MIVNPQLTMKFTQLEEAMQTPHNPHPKIQRVTHYLRDRKHFTMHYSPKLVSIGPIHHGEKNLNLGEQYKLMWASMYLKRNEQNPQTLYQKIAEKIEQLKDLFAKDVIEGFHDNEKLSWMLFVDGCSLLQILDEGNLDNSKKMNVKLDQLALVRQDVLLLENQLPYQVLKLLSVRENDANLLKIMNKFLQCHHLSPVRPHQSAEKWDVDKDQDSEEEYTSITLTEEETQQPHKESPIHLLDQLRRAILHDPPAKEAKNQDRKQKGMRNNKGNNKNEDNGMITYRNIKELRAAGIRLNSSKSRRLRDIKFSCGWLCAELKLPVIIVDDTTAPTFLNLIAYEMCPDFENNYEICSFVAFMDSLIDHPDDVKELRSAGILLNALGSDEEVSKLFNTIGTDLVPDMDKYAHIRPQIEKHYRNKCKTWIALGYHTYFSNPWAFIAFLAAVFALLLTFIQTLFAINPAS
ncbi:UPF0481 protein At3g47200-like [Gastrolobium bilobum]|uniref:UPF0481 protein At3g47200-like n=1 Tax=Gastrolobium bilobum TaxID=150636 RepID=UPI002AB1DC55|nr:UPF0481 protein At3g47200-like [Gastrolobium bilobum]